MKKFQNLQQENGTLLMVKIMDNMVKENNSTIKFETEVIKPSLCDYSDAYILVTEDITAQGGNANTKVAFKNCAAFKRCVTHINDEHVETAENLDIIISMYNLLECSDNCESSSGSLWQFKRDEQNLYNDGNIADVTTADSLSFKYKSSFIENVNDAKIIGPLKYLFNFFRSFEMPLVNCKIHLELNWIKSSVMSTALDDNNTATTFQITSKKLYAPVVTLSTKNSLKLIKQLNKGLKRSVYWNEHKSKVEAKPAVNNNITRFLLDSSFQGVNRLFVFLLTILVMVLIEFKDIIKKYFLQRVNITKYNVSIYGRNFYDQRMDDQIKNYDEIRKISVGRGNDYTTGCLLDYQYILKHYQLIAVDLSKQKELDADPRAIQQIEFYGMLGTNSI